METGKSIYESRRSEMRREIQWEIILTSKRFSFDKRAVKSSSAKGRQKGRLSGNYCKNQCLEILEAVGSTRDLE